LTTGGHIRIADHWQAITALSGHLDADDVRLLGVNVDSIAYQQYTDPIYVKTQLNVLKMLDFGIDIKPFKLN
jgi:hypothetical protein